MDPVTFGPIGASPSDGRDAFTVRSSDGSLMVSAATGGAVPDGPLVHWSFVADPACAVGATHFAVLVEERGAAVDRESLFVSACGTRLEAAGTV